jgi:uncharacterized repeat protein (TIGR01451 family)/CSLREA domain-containing protein
MIFDNPFSRWAIRITGSFIALAASASVASAATITVTTGLDQYGTGAPGECSLREAIQSANQDSNFDQCVGVGPYGNDVIVFTPTVTLVQLTITTGLTSNDDNSFLDLDIRDINPPGALVIDGGPNSVTIQPGILSWTDRIFDIPQVGGQPSPVTLRNLTIQGGGPTLSNETPPIGDPCFNSGGGVRNWSGGALTLENVTIQNNTMPANGGGVCQSGSGALTVLTSTIQNNVATIRNGGGIAYLGTGALLVQSSTVLSNSAGTDGGGIYDQSSALTVQNSQVLSNTVNNAFSGGTGGGVWTAGGTSPKQIVTSTVAFNRAGGDGGGIWNQTSSGLQLFNSTVLSNTAGAFLANPGNGGGIWSGQPLTIENSQVLSNTALFTGTIVPTVPPGGGGIYQQSAQMTVGNSRVAHNLARALDGFLIAGGGIWNSGIATLNNAVVEHNRADGVPMGGRAYGGGIHNENDLNLLSNSQVRHNRAEWFSAYGGGVSNENNSGGNATFTLNASSVSTNTAQGDPIMGGFAGGGGIYSTGTADLLAGEVRNNLAAGGQSAGGGGVDSNGILTVTSSLVISNAATASLGGSNGGGIQTGGSAALITNTQIYTNTAGNGGGWYNNVFSAQLNNSDVRFNEAATKDGGGVYNLGNNVQINDSAICQNQAQQHGGGVYNGAPILIIGQTTICLNQAGLGGVGDGGGIYNNVNGGLQVMMSQVLTNTTVDNGGGIYNASPNSGILNSTVQSNTASAGGGAYNAAGNMLIDTSTLRTNQASGDGGGAYNADQMFVVASTVQSNTAGSLGGGVYNALSAMGLFVNFSTLRGNNAASGGGLYNESSANVSFSALVNNTANFGGGVGNAPGGALSSENNTFSGNSAPNGGGLNVSPGSSAYLTFTTVASNTAGGGINVSSGGTAEVYATLLAYNAGSNCLGGVTNNGFSMSSDASCSFAFNNINPLLQPLALNGGQTLNHALSPGSQALDKVPSAQCTASVDQRSVSRPQGTACDIGAFELEEADLVVSKTATPTVVLAGQVVTYVVTVTNTGPSTANNVVITDVLQGGATFGGVVATSGGATLSSSTSTAVTFTVSALPVGGLAVVVYSIIAPPTGTITNTVTVAATEFDPQPANNTATVTTPVIPVANLSISKAPSFPTAIAGTITPSAQLTYTILVTNSGPSSANSVTVTDNLPAGLTFVSATGSGWSCSNSGQTVTCTVSSLSMGAAPAIQIVASAPVTPGLVLTNTAVVNAATFPNTPVTSNSVVVKVQFRAFLPIARRP